MGCEAVIATEHYLDITTEQEGESLLLSHFLRATNCEKLSDPDPPAHPVALKAMPERRCSSIRCTIWAISCTATSGRLPC
jgi:hypothetical protein